MKINSSVIAFLLLIIGFILIIWLVIWYGIYFWSADGFEKSINIILSTIQAIAIIFGGWLAYKKLVVEKKIDGAIKIKGELMRYVEKHNFEIENYRRHSDIVEYKVAMIGDYNDLIKNLHLSVLPKELREDIFEALFLDIAISKEKVDEELRQFGNRIKKIYKKLDEIILY
jgi:hypothetical protein